MAQRILSCVASITSDSRLLCEITSFNGEVKRRALGSNKFGLLTVVLPKGMRCIKKKNGDIKCKMPRKRRK